jgi:hypothetical protein
MIISSSPSSFTFQRGNLPTPRFGHSVSTATHDSAHIEQSKAKIREQKTTGTNRLKAYGQFFKTFFRNLFQGSGGKSSPAKLWASLKEKSVNAYEDTRDWVREFFQIIKNDAKAAWTLLRVRFKR